MLHISSFAVLHFKVIYVGMKGLTYSITIKKEGLKTDLGALFCSLDRGLLKCDCPIPGSSGGVS